MVEEGNIEVGVVLTVENIEHVWETRTDVQVLSLRTDWSSPRIGRHDVALEHMAAVAGFPIPSTQEDPTHGPTVPQFTAPSLVQLWPEHFDAALDMAFEPAAPAERRVNVGGSPGDGFHSAPYLYVGPWTPERPDDATFWNAPFGAVVGHETIATTPDPVEAAFEFFSTGLELLTI